MINRRKFIKQALGAVVALEGLYLLWSLSNKPHKNSDNLQMFKAGAESDFEPGRIYPFTRGSFFLQKIQNGTFLALSAKCTHLGCIIQSDADGSGFACPCHASRFDKSGIVLSPPAVRALDEFKVYLKNGEVWVDIHNPQKRNNL